MEIEYIFRAPGKAFSIERVFNSILQGVKNTPETNCRKSHVKDLKPWPLALIYNIIRYAIKSYRYKNRIFHITGDIQYIGCLMNPRNTVLTIHDLVPIKNPQVPWYSKKICYWLWYYIPLKRLKKITCISEKTYKDLNDAFNINRKKLQVIYNPVDSNYLPKDKSFNTLKPTILHIGTNTNKNLDRVIEALDGINCSLRIIGPLSSHHKELLQKHGIIYSNDSGLSDDEIIREYENADIISFPSLYEGFGMPVIEGQRTGRIVLTSNIEPMKTIAGRGAYLVDPTKASSIRNGFLDIIKNPNLRESIIKFGEKNSNKFLIKTIVPQYLKLYESLMAKHV